METITAGTIPAGTDQVGMCATTVPGSPGIGGAVRWAGIAGVGAARDLPARFRFARGLAGLVRGISGQARPRRISAKAKISVRAKISGKAKISSKISAEADLTRR